jgi:esterase
VAIAGERAEEVAALRAAAEIANIGVREVVLPEDHDIVVRGMRFHYLDWPSPSRRPALLFLHGGALNAHTFDLVNLALRSEYRCLALDLRGHGDSEWSPVLDYAIATHSADVAAFVDRLELPPLVMVGMSLGGLAAIHYAGRHAAQLAGLVIIDTGPDGQSRGRERIHQFADATMVGFPTVEDYVVEAMKFNPRRRADLLRRSLLHNLRQTPAGTWVWKWDPRPRATPVDPELARRRRAALWDDVPRISCATLVVRGAQSDTFSEENAQALVGSLPNGRLVEVQGAGHTVQGDNPRDLLRELRTFLGGLEHSDGASAV